MILILTKDIIDSCGWFFSVQRVEAFPIGLLVVAGCSWKLFHCIDGFEVFRLLTCLECACSSKTSVVNDSGCQIDPLKHESRQQQSKQELA